MEQNRAYVRILLQDLSGKDIPDAIEDMEDLLANCRRRIASKVDKAVYSDAEFLFNGDSTALIERQEELLAAKMQPKNRNATGQRQQRPNKRPRKVVNGRKELVKQKAVSFFF